MLKVRYSAKFKKDYKLIEKRKYDTGILWDIVGMLKEEQTLPEKYDDHALIGNYKSHRSCHIAPDWLLIYKQEQDILTLTLTRTGTHSDLYKK